MARPLVNQPANEVRFGRHAALDGVRGIAVLMVVVTHFASLSPANYHYFYAGLLGVDIFFVLSGFLITSILLQEFEATQKINLKRFYIRRFLRLMPAYWACLFLIHFVGPHLLSYWEAEHAASNRTLFLALIYMTNWQEVAGAYIGVFSHLWSLAVEEQFYLIWAPLLLALLIRMKSRFAIAGTTLFFTVFLLFSFEMKMALGTVSTAYLYGATDCRLVPLLLGALASMVFLWNGLPARFVASRWLDVVALMSLLAAALLASRFNLAVLSSYGIMPWFALTLAIMTFWIAVRNGTMIHSVLSFGPLVWVGRISYGLYLWHHFMVAFVRDQTWPLSAKLIIGVGLSFLITILSYYLLELPFLRLKERFAAAGGGKFADKSVVATIGGESLAPSVP